MLELRGVPHRHVAVEDIVIAPTHPLTRHVTSLDKVGDDALRRPLGDAHGLSDVT